MPQDVERTDGDDRPVAPEPAIGNEAADDRQQVAAGAEVMHHRRRMVLRHVQVVDGEGHEQALHAVEAAAFSELRRPEEPEPCRVLCERCEELFQTGCPWLFQPQPEVCDRIVEVSEHSQAPIWKRSAAGKVIEAQENRKNEIFFEINKRARGVRTRSRRRRTSCGANGI